jgi:hypothetical protein
LKGLRNEVAHLPEFTVAGSHVLVEHKREAHWRLTGHSPGQAQWRKKASRRTRGPARTYYVFWTSSTPGSSATTAAGPVNGARVRCALVRGVEGAGCTHLG